MLLQTPTEIPPVKGDRHVGWTEKLNSWVKIVLCIKNHIILKCNIVLSQSNNKLTISSWSFNIGQPLCTLSGHRQTFLYYDVFMSLKVVLTLANSVNPDEMQHYAAFHLGLHCLPKYLFRSFQYSKGWTGFLPSNFGSRTVSCWSSSVRVRLAPNIKLFVSNIASFRAGIQPPYNKTSDWLNIPTLICQAEYK